MMQCHKSPCLFKHPSPKLQSKPLEIMGSHKGYHNPVNIYALSTIYEYEICDSY